MKITKIISIIKNISIISFTSCFMYEYIKTKT